MRILRHRLESDNGQVISWDPSPNVSNADFEPRYLVIHYTAGSSFNSSVSWLTDERARASAHVVIGRDGEIAQLARFDQRAWHAGRSRWRGLTGLNEYSIGIELDNAGPLIEDAGGATWTATFGGQYGVIDVFRGEHKHGSEFEYWHRYPQAQLETAIIVASTIVEKYSLLDVIGHDDIAPGRKLDPGPAFPLASFRSRVMGREDDEMPVGRTVTDLNIRSGPGMAYETVDDPLTEGTELLIRSEAGSWLAVDVLVNSQPSLSGWVHGDYVAVEAAVVP